MFPRTHHLVLALSEHHPTHMDTVLRLPRASRPWILLVLLLSITGCLTIEENYTFKSDGSGTMEYVVDMSPMAEIMKGFGDGKSEPMDSGSKAKLEQLRAMEGVKKVKLKREKEGYVERISFTFTDLAALNRALNVLMPDSTGVQQTFFTWEGNTLVRANNRFAEGLGNEMVGTDSTSTDIAEVLKSMHYKYNFKFARNIVDADLAEGVLREAPGAREMKVHTDWSVIMKDPKALDLRITLGE